MVYRGLLRTCGDRGVSEASADRTRDFGQHPVRILPQHLAGAGELWTVLMLQSGFFAAAVYQIAPEEPAAGPSGSGSGSGGSGGMGLGPLSAETRAALSSGLAGWVGEADDEEGESDESSAEGSEEEYRKYNARRVEQRRLRANGTGKPKAVSELLASTPAAAAAAINVFPRCLLHKRFHRYTTRRKQGGSQSAHDAKGKAANSVGAQMRRAGEQHLKQDIADLLTSRQWQPLIDASRRVVVACPTAMRAQLFQTDVLERRDPRVLVVPFMVGRPALLETQRIATALATVLPVAPLPPAAVAAPSASSAAAGGKAGSGPQRGGVALDTRADFDAVRSAFNAMSTSTSARAAGSDAPSESSALRTSTVAFADSLLASAAALEAEGRHLALDGDTAMESAAEEADSNSAADDMETPEQYLARKGRPPMTRGSGTEDEKDSDEAEEKEDTAKTETKQQRGKQQAKQSTLDTWFSPKRNAPVQPLPGSGSSLDSSDSSSSDSDSSAPSWMSAGSRTGAEKQTQKKTQKQQPKQQTSGKGKGGKSGNKKGKPAAAGAGGTAGGKRKGVAGRGGGGSGQQKGGEDAEDADLALLEAASAAAATEKAVLQRRQCDEASLVSLQQMLTASVEAAARRTLVPVFALARCLGLRYLDDGPRRPGVIPHARTAPREAEVHAAFAALETLGALLDAGAGAPEAFLGMGWEALCAAVMVAGGEYMDWAQFMASEAQVLPTAEAVEIEGPVGGKGGRAGKGKGKGKGGKGKAGNGAEDIGADAVPRPLTPVPAVAPVAATPLLSPAEERRRKVLEAAEARRIAALN
jgi:hypothetical protein